MAATDNANQNLVVTAFWEVNPGEEAAVASLLKEFLPQAQRDAVKLYGFDETHTSVLRNAQVSLLLNQLLAETFR